MELLDESMVVVFRYWRFALKVFWVLMMSVQSMMMVLLLTE